MKKVSDAEFVVNETARLVVEAILSSSKRADQVSTWLLAGYGITGSLIIGNLEDLAEAVGSQRVRHGVLLLIVGGFFGLLQKYLALRVGVLMEVDSVIRNGAAALDRENGMEGPGSWEIDLELLVRIRQRILEVSSCWGRKAIANQLDKRLADPLALHKTAAGFLGRQLIYGVVEVLCFVAVVLLFGIAI